MPSITTIVTLLLPFTIFTDMFEVFGNFIGRPLSWMTGAVFGQPTSSASNGPGSGTAGPDDVDPYEPSVLDVLVVKAMLNKVFALPPELLNTILDSAEYWPRSTTEWSGGPLSIYGGRPMREDVFLVRQTWFDRLGSFGANKLRTASLDTAGLYQGA